MKLNQITRAAALAAVLAAPSIFATGAFAASPTRVEPEAQRSGDPKAEAAAEEKHKAKSHGTNKAAKQPEAQMQADPKARAAAEAKHNAKPHGGLDVSKTIPLEDGSTVYVFQNGKMGMEDKVGRPTRMKPGHVMKAKDGTQLIMVGDEVMRVESLRTEKRGGPN